MIAKYVTQDSDCMLDALRRLHAEAEAHRGGALWRRKEDSPGRNAHAAGRGISAEVVLYDAIWQLHP
jgi:hypothetical protein